jgi:hypothetical protein
MVFERRTTERDCVRTHWMMSLESGKMTAQQVMLYQTMGSMKGLTEIQLSSPYIQLG